MSGILAPIWQIASRDLRALTGSMWGWSLLASKVMVDALLFQGVAMTGRARLSEQVLGDLFDGVFVTTLLLGVMVTMRLFPPERASGTWALLCGSPLTSAQIVLGKCLGAWLALLGLTATTLHLPAWVALHGKIAWGHVGVGYLGVALVAAAVSGVGTLASAHARTQLQAALVSAGALTLLLLGWLLARVSAPPLDALLAGLSFYDANFRGFRQGQLQASAVLYYLGIAGWSLWAAILVMKSRRGA